MSRHIPAAAATDDIDDGFTPARRSKATKPKGVAQPENKDARRTGGRGGRQAGDRPTTERSERKLGAGESNKKGSGQEKRRVRPQRPRVAREPLSIPANKSILLQHMDKLCYQDRMSLAARLGIDHRGTAELKKLVTDLRTHPAPPTLPADGVDDEPEFDTMFPPQTNNIKFYHEDQIALAVAAQAHQKDVLEQELKSRSIFFKKFCISKVVGIKRDDDKKGASPSWLFTDDQLHKLVVEASPSSRRVFIRALMRHWRTPVLEALWPIYRKQYGDDDVARFMHGCSSKLVAANIHAFKDNVHVRWNKLNGTHAPVVTAAIESDLKVAAASANPVHAIPQVWQDWDRRFTKGKADERLLAQGHQSGPILQLALRYACYGTHPYRTFLKYTIPPNIAMASELKSIQTQYQRGIGANLPSMVTTRHQHYARYFGRQMTAWMFITTSWTPTSDQDNYDDAINYQGLQGVLGSLGNMHLGQEYDREGIVAYAIACLTEVPTRSRRWDYTRRQDTILALMKGMPRYLENKLLDAVLAWVEKTRPAVSLGKDTWDGWRDRAKEVYATVHSSVMQRYTKYTTRINDCFWDLSYGYIYLDTERIARRIRTSETALAQQHSLLLNKVALHRVATFTKQWRHKDESREDWIRLCCTVLESASTRLTSAIIESRVEFPGQWAMTELKSILPVLLAASPLGQNEAKVASSSHGWTAPSPTEAPNAGRGPPEAPEGSWGDDGVYRAHGSGSQASQFTLQVTGYVTALYKWLFARQINARTDETRRQVQTDLNTSFNYFWSLFKPHKLSYVDSILQWMSYISGEHKLTVWRSWTFEELRTLGRANTDQLVKLIDIVSRLGLANLSVMLPQLLANGVLAVDTASTLSGYQQLTGDVFKVMSKACDSNSIPQRSAAYRNLILATVRGRSQPQLVKTLTLLVKKIKNEAALNRVDVIEQLLGGVNMDDIPYKKQSFMALSPSLLANADGAFLLSAEALPLWFEMLQDCFEVQDLDEHNDMVAEKSVAVQVVRAAMAGTPTKQTPTGPQPWCPPLIRIVHSHTEYKRRALDIPSFATDNESYVKMTKLHYMLGFFYQLSIAAIRRGASDPAKSPLFNFGVEIQWRIAVFRLGDKYAAQRFRIDSGRSLTNYRLPYSNQDGAFVIDRAAELPDTKEANDAFVKAWIKAYEDRVVDRYPKWQSDPVTACSYYDTLYRILGKSAFAVPLLNEHLTRVIAAIRACPKDHEGLSIINGDHDAIRIFEFLLDLQGRTWADVPILREYVELIMRSRQARRVFWRWYAWKSKNATTRSEHRHHRNALVTELLSISKSAIYIRFVWRHLIRFAQDQLEPYLNAESTFRGVFYLPPDQRGKLPESGPVIPEPIIHPNQLERMKKTRQYAILSGSRYPSLLPVTRARGGGRGGRMRGGGRGGGRVRPVRKSSARYTKMENQRYTWWEKGSIVDAVAAVKEENELELQLEDERREFGRRDFIQYWKFPACRGLHRLLPRQTMSLAVAHARAGLNPDRGIPDRVKSIILWSLLPTTTYIDVVQFANKPLEYDPEVMVDEKKQAAAQAASEVAAKIASDRRAAEEAKKKAAEAEAAKVVEVKSPGGKKPAKGAAKAAAAAAPVVVAVPEVKEVKEGDETAVVVKKKKKVGKFPINISEALIKGAMHNDNRFAPLRYLLQPKFLSSQHARVAIYAVGGVVCHMSPSLLNKVLKFILSGKRRNALKVTAYKETLRLVASSKTVKNMETIMHEWERKEVHRDVRIAMIQIAIDFLSIPDGRGNETGWKILDSAVRDDNKEILVALLGVLPKQFADRYAHLSAEEKSEAYGLVTHFQPESLCQDPKLAVHIQAMRKCVLPNQHTIRYMKTIICHLAGADMDDDVRTMAMACLADWVPFGGNELCNSIAELWRSELLASISTDAGTPTRLVDPRAKTQKVYDARFKFFASMLQMLTGYRQPQKWSTFPKVERFDLQSITTELVNRMTAPTTDRATRLALFNRTDEWIRLPHAASNGGRRLGDRILITDPIFRPVVRHRKGALFWKVLCSRRYDTLEYYYNHSRPYGDDEALPEHVSFEVELRRHFFTLFRDVTTANISDAEFFVAKTAKMFGKVTPHCKPGMTAVIHDLMEILRTSVPRSKKNGGKAMPTMTVDAGWNIPAASSLTSGSKPNHVAVKLLFADEATLADEFKDKKDGDAPAAGRGRGGRGGRGGFGGRGRGGRGGAGWADEAPPAAVDTDEDDGPGGMAAAMAAAGNDDNDDDDEDSKQPKKPKKDDDDNEDEDDSKDAPAVKNYCLSATQQTVATTILLHAISIIPSYVNSNPVAGIWFVEHVLRAAASGVWQRSQRGAEYGFDSDATAWIDVNTRGGWTSFAVEGLWRLLPATIVDDIVRLLTRMLKPSTETAQPHSYGRGYGRATWSLSPHVRTILRNCLQAALAPITPGPTEHTQRAYKQLNAQVLLAWGHIWPSFLASVTILGDDTSSFASLVREWLRLIVLAPVEFGSNAAERKVKTIRVIIGVVAHLQQLERHKELTKETALPADGTSAAAGFAADDDMAVADTKEETKVDSNTPTFSRVTEDLGEKTVIPFIERVLTDNLADAKESLQAKEFELFAALSFDVALAVVNAFPRILVRSTELTLLFIREAIGRSVLLPALTTTVRTSLRDIIVAALHRPLMEANKEAKSASDDTLTSLPLWTTFQMILNPLIFSVDTKVTTPSRFSAYLLKAPSDDANALKAWTKTVKSPAYHHLAGLIALDVVVTLADYTKIVAPPSDAAALQKRAAERAATKKAAAAVEAKKAGEKKGAVKPVVVAVDESAASDAETAVTRYVWRDEFVELLAQFTDDTDTTIHRLAFFQGTISPFKKLDTKPPKAAKPVITLPDGTTKPADDTPENILKLAAHRKKWAATRTQSDARSQNYHMDDDDSNNELNDIYM